MTDVFAVGRGKLKKDIKKQRQMVMHKRARRLELVYLAVDYFKEGINKGRRILTDQIEKSKDSMFSFSPASWKTDYKRIMQIRRESSEAHIEN